MEGDTTLFTFAIRFFLSELLRQVSRPRQDSNLRPYSFREYNTYRIRTCDLHRFTVTLYQAELMCYLYIKIFIVVEPLTAFALFHIYTY